MTGRPARLRAPRRTTDHGPRRVRPQPDRAHGPRVDPTMEVGSEVGGHHLALGAVRNALKGGRLRPVCSDAAQAPSALSASVG